MKPLFLIQRGLSLIEVMVVTTVLAMLLLFVGPEVGTWMRNVQIRNTAEAMQHGLVLARTEAIRRNRSVQFSLVTSLTAGCALSSKAGSWIVSLDDPAGQCGTAPSEGTVPKIVALRNANEGGAHVSVKALQADGATAADKLAFDGFGRAIGTMGVARVDIDHAAPGTDYRALRITVTPTGNVRLCDPKVNPASDDPRRC